MSDPKDPDASDPYENDAAFPEPDRSLSQFDLGRPNDPEFERYAQQRDTQSGALGDSVPGKSGKKSQKKPNAEEPKYKAMAWKGFEEEEEVETVPFGKRGKREEAEMDMTPMVDVTFLLLIFFMVTASFKLQKAIEQPPDLSDEPSDVVLEQEEEQEEAIEIFIDENDNYLIQSNETDPEEAAGKVEMWSKVRLVKNGSPNAKRLLITVDENASHGAVINAWDAGADAGIGQISISITKGQQ